MNARSFSTHRQWGFRIFLYQSKSLDGFHDVDVIDIITQAADLAARLSLDGGDKLTYHQALVKFGEAKGIWSKTEKEKHAKFNSLDWWTLSNRFPTLKSLALRILSISTSSACSERCWSVHAFIHTKRRNRLTPERVEKLVFIYSNMGDKEAANSLIYKVFPDARDECDEADLTNPFLYIDREQIDADSQNTTESTS